MVIPYLLPPSTTFRISGIYGQPNLFSLLLLVGLLGIFFYYISAADNISSGLQRLRMIPVVLVGLVFFLTQSRAGIVALAVLSFCLYIAFRSGWLCRTRKQRQEFFLFALATSISFLFYEIIIRTELLPWLLNVQAGNLSRGDALQGLGIDARIIFYTAAILMFFDHPLFGVGLWQYKNHLPEYQILAHDYLGFVEYEAIVYAKWAHNEYLQLLAEGGIVIGACMLVGLILYAKSLYKTIRYGGDVKYVFATFSILLFLVFAVFTFPLHYPPLFALFLTLMGLFLSSKDGFTFRMNRYLRMAFSVCLIIVLILVSNLFVDETRVGQLHNQILAGGELDNSIKDFSALVDYHYNEYNVLIQFLPRLIDSAISQDNVLAGKKLLPYAQEMVHMEGAYWQWFYLAKLFLFLDRDSEARDAINASIDRKPDWGDSWHLLHYINIRKASLETARPMESFFPNKDYDPELYNGPNFSF